MVGNYVGQQGAVGQRQRQQAATTRIPPSVSRPARRKRIDVGGKLYEDEFVVLNVRLKQYGYENAMKLMLDFKDRIFPERYFSLLLAA